jgi:hypothetical protein
MSRFQTDLDTQYSIDCLADLLNLQIVDSVSRGFLWSFRSQIFYSNIVFCASLRRIHMRMYIQRVVWTSFIYKENILIMW